MSDQSTPLEMTPDPDFPLAKKRKGGAQPGSKVSAEVLARRKEGRIKAMATMQSQIEKSGIKRMESNNKLAVSSIVPVPLINQKNYYTDYLKKDDQMTMLRDIKEFNLKLKESKQQKMIEKLKQASSTVTPEVGTLNAVKDEENDDDDEDEDDDLEFTKIGSDTIVIHPGTTYIRMGLATDVYPKVIPNVILYPRAGTRFAQQLTKPVTPPRTTSDDDEGDIIIDNAEFNENKAIINGNFRERMRYYKRRILPNSSEQCFNYNKRIIPEKIPEHNDIHRLEFTNSKEVLKEKKYLIGDEALKLDSLEDWFLRSPLKDGDFNDEGYTSTQEVLGDLELIIGTVLKQEFQISKKISNNYKVVIIIPNLYSKTYIDSLMSLFLKSLNFGKVAIIQEGIAATFGSGISSACIVDIGATTTKISCIDEGMILENSQINLLYGGDDVTRVFTTMLLQNQFPYHDLNLNDINDWKLAEELKVKFVTFQDADVAIQVYNFMVRKPNKLTEKYEFKVFDEVMTSAMGLFYPEIFKSLREPVKDDDKIFPRHVDYFTGKLDDPGSLAQENTTANNGITSKTDEELLQYMSDVSGETQPWRKLEDEYKENFTPLDILIIESITQSSYMDLARLKKLYENILIVGGGSKISGFDNILYDRINIWRSRLLSNSNLEEILKLIELSKQEFLKTREKEEPFKISSLIMSKVQDLLDTGTVLPVEILSSSREIDPQILSWKGGSVYGRIKVVNEMMVDYKEYDLLGLRCFQYKSMFNF